MASQRKEVGNNKLAQAFSPETHLQPTLRALRCWGIIERQTNQQQKAKLEKQMYNTLTVCPNIAKPMLAAVLLLRTVKAYGFALLSHN